MADIISVEGLYKSYGDIKAVDGVDFSVQQGSTFAFLGVNGAGKTTTINILCSILKKDDGKVFIDGKDLDANAKEIKNLTGIVFQGSVLDDRLTVRQNLKIRAALYGIYGDDFDKRLAETAANLSFGDFIDRPYGKLSGGQRRRIDIARALLHRPKILFLDEPTTGLDPNTRIAVWEIVNRLRAEENLTVFLTTHYMEEANNADKVVIIDKGKIAAAGTPNGLKNDYTFDYIKIYTQNSTQNDEVLSKQNVDFCYKNNGYIVKMKSIKEVKNFIAKNDSILTDFEVIKGDMDDVFLDVTGRSLAEQSAVAE